MKIRFKYLKLEEVTVRRLLNVELSGGPVLTPDEFNAIQRIIMITLSDYAGNIFLEKLPQLRNSVVKLFDTHPGVSRDEHGRLSEVDRNRVNAITSVIDHMGEVFNKTRALQARLK